MNGNGGLDGETRGVLKRNERLQDLHEVASMLLEGLDELGLHEAAAYVSLARRRIRDQHPILATLATEDSLPRESGG